MARMAPEGPVYQAGTLSGNPLAMAAGAETLRRMSGRGTYTKLANSARQLARGFAEAADDAGLELSTTSVGGLFGFFFHPGPVRNMEEARESDAARFGRFFRAMLEQGIYLAPSPFECGFVSLAHKPSDLEQTLAAARRAMHKAARTR
jgi:glutamate-1-semialdehyde 2,1-aminomutase